MSESNAVYSTMVRSGRTTYFIDVREAKNGNKYISISETKIDADDKRQRSTIRVFGESVEQFSQAITRQLLPPVNRRIHAHRKEIPSGEGCQRR